MTTSKAPSLASVIERLRDDMIAYGNACALVKPDGTIEYLDQEDVLVHKNRRRAEPIIRNHARREHKALPTIAWDATGVTIQFEDREPVKVPMERMTQASASRKGFDKLLRQAVDTAAVLQNAGQL